MDKVLERDEKYVILLINHRNKLDENASYYDKEYSIIKEKLNFNLNLNHPNYISAIKKTKVILEKPYEINSKLGYSINNIKLHCYGD